MPPVSPPTDESSMANRLRHRLTILRNVLSGLCVHRQIVPLPITSTNNSGSAGSSSDELRRTCDDAGMSERLTKESAEKDMSLRRTTRSKARLRITYLVCILLPSVLLAVVIVIWIEDGVKPLTKPSHERTDTDCERQVVTTLIRCVVIVFDHRTEKNGSNATRQESIIVLFNCTDGCSCANSSLHPVPIPFGCCNNTRHCGSDGVNFTMQDGSGIIGSLMYDISNASSLCTLDVSSLNICDSFNSSQFNQTSIVCVFEINSNKSDFTFIGCNINNFQASPSPFLSSASSAETKDLYMIVFLSLFAFLLHVTSTISLLRFSARRFRRQITSVELAVSALEIRWKRVKTEQQRSNQLLGEMLPSQIANRLKVGQTVDPETFDKVTVYFSDIPGFNTIALTVFAIDIVNLLNSVFR